VELYPHVRTVRDFQGFQADFRRGYAIEMVDQVYDRNGTDVGLEVALINALGYVNGTKVTNEILEKNPGWTSQTTRFEIWSDITSTAEQKGIFISPDVHVGKAQWCCSVSSCLYALF
jgi:endoglucanase